MYRAMDQAAPGRNLLQEYETESQKDNIGHALVFIPSLSLHLLPLPTVILPHTHRDDPETKIAHGH